MNGARADLGANQAGADLHQTTWIPSRHPRRMRGANVRQLRSENCIRSIGLDQIVDTGAAAALIEIVERNELQTGNGGEQGLRRLVYAVRGDQITKAVVRDFHRRQSNL